MRDHELLTYYEKELTFIRRMAAEFADRYPRIADRLQLERDKCDDPHVERLIESFALLAARVHLKLDDEFPEITESLLQVLYPHYLAPVPSMSIAEFTLDPSQGKISTGYLIDRGQTLNSKLVEDTSCRFRTCYPVTLWPLEVQSAELEGPGRAGRDGTVPAAALVLGLATQGDATFAELEIPSLRFFLSGESHAHQLYEAVLGHCYGVELRNPADPGAPPIRLSAKAISEIGFGKDEGMLPYSSRSHLGYRLLQEYFCFPKKFLFFDVGELHHLRAAGFGARADLVFLLDQPIRLQQTLDAKTFRLGCTPIVNLFRQMAEPIRMDRAHTEYQIIPDFRRQTTTEVYSVDNATAISPATGEKVEYRPFYSFKHSFDGRRPSAFWHASRRPSTRKGDAGTEVYLTLVDLDFKPTTPESEVLTIVTTCTNRDLPERLPLVESRIELDVEGAAPVRATCEKPTQTLRPPLRHGAQWRLISHLSLNYLSPVESDEHGTPEALREILRVYDFSDAAEIQQQIAGLTSVRSQQVVRRIPRRDGVGFARGVETTVEFDDTRFVGSGVYLFSSVLEKFLALGVSVNSFSEMVAISRQRGKVKRWPVRAGYQPLL